MFDAVPSGDQQSLLPDSKKTALENSWTDCIGRAWSNATAGEIIIVGAGAAAAIISLRYGGPLVARAISLTRAVAPAVGETGEPALARNVASFSKCALHNFDMMAEDAVETSLAAQPGPTSSTLSLPALASPAVKTPSERIGSVLTDPDKIRNLADRIGEHLRSWPDLSTMDKEALAIRKRLKVTTEAGQSIMRAEGFGGTLEALKIGELKSLQQSTSSQAARDALRNIISSRYELNKARDAVNLEIRDRQNQLEDTIQAFSKQSLLPGSQFRFRILEGKVGNYSDSQLTLHQKLCIQRPIIPRVAEVAAHELTHHEQAYLQISNAADRLGIGAHATAEQMAILNDAVPLTSKRSLKPSLDMRAGRRLTEEAEQRAGLIADSRLQLRAMTHPDTIAQNQKWYEILEQLKSKDAVKLIFENEARPEQSLSAALAVDKPGSPAARAIIEELAPAHSKLEEPWSNQFKDQVDQILGRHIQRGRLLSNDLRRAWNQAYGAAYHEREAFANGSIALEQVLKVKPSPLVVMQK